MLIIFSWLNAVPKSLQKWLARPDFFLGKEILLAHYWEI